MPVPAAPRRTVAFKREPLRRSVTLRAPPSLSKPLPSLPARTFPKTPWATEFKLGKRRVSASRNRHGTGGSVSSSTQPHHAPRSLEKYQPKPPSTAGSRSTAETTLSLKAFASYQEDSFHTRYMDMLLKLDAIPRLDNILSLFFCWILLAGFVLFQGSFSAQATSSARSATAATAPSAPRPPSRNVPILAVSAACCAVGLIGMACLSLRWRRNYIWLLNRLYIPGAMNAAVGLAGTLAAVYTQQGGAWTATSAAAAGVEAACLIACAGLFVLFNNVLLRRARRLHESTADEKSREAGREHGSFMERLARQPAFAPGSVV